MERDKIYLRELSCYKKAENEQKKVKNPEGYYDLLKLPTNTMREEMRQYIIERGKTVSHSTVYHERRYYNQISSFLNQTDTKNLNSFLDRPQEKWIQMLKGWMLQEGKPLTFEKQNIYGLTNVVTERLLQYFRRMLKFIQPEHEKEEIERDVWRLEMLNMELRGNPIYNVKTLDFKKIYQPGLREEVKRVIYMNLQYEAIGTVQNEMTAIRKFSKYLKKEHVQIQSCAEIDRNLLEEYLISLNTGLGSHLSNHNSVLALRSVLEGIGKLYGYTNLENSFLNTDIPPVIQPKFRNYSDAEIKRLNAKITELDEQIARCLVIHQLLGTRISDTLTLRCDCLYMESQQHMICIHQVKTSTCKKPISMELAELIKRAICYTREKYGESKYIFVNDKDINRPMQYTTIKHKVMGMIFKENLLDDSGRLFHFSTHLFRHYYGVKLTEMHLDDWTIARLLGHKRLSSVQHYRKMSNQRMADETRDILNMMTELIYENLDGWGEEYEQIRQDD